MSDFSICDFLDIEAIIAEEEEEDYEEEEDTVGYVVDDDEPTLDNKTDYVLPPSLLGPEVQDLEDEARRITARAAPDDPSIWSIGVKLGQETDVVSQICHRCLIPGEIHLPAITSAFARLSILGRVFIEASMS
ncbi:hypothetical protein BC827DRAFT_1271937 [Russula dissimulans]|nr:hypothetical protein BC827DRAFT_1271937 [Russula dissimulans]